VFRTPSLGHDDDELITLSF